MKILSIFGTRPELVKLSALFSLLDKKSDHTMLHTGQHYSKSLDQKIRRDLGIRKPDYTLRMRGDSFAQQLSSILPTIEKILLNKRPDFVIVQGDTNSSLA